MKTPICKAPSCGKPFTKYRSTQQTCYNPQCALEYARYKSEKKLKRERSREKKNFNHQDRSYMMKRAQKACNEYIRTRDAHLPCVSCGNKSRQMHAGHFKTVGAQSALRFHWANIHKQCSQCNNFKSANLVEYEPNLISKVGQEMVDFLKQDHSPQKLTIDDLDDIWHWFKLLTCRTKDPNRALPHYLKNWLAQTPQ